MLDLLQGKKTIVAGFLVAFYGLLKAFFPNALPTLPDGWEETALGILFILLRLVTKGPQTITNWR